MPDKYDAAVDHLRRHPNEIWDAWQFCSSHPAGCIFTHAKNACGEYPPALLGLPGAVRQRAVAGLDIPHASAARPSDLAAFAEFECRLDRELGRT